MTHYPFPDSRGTKIAFAAFFTAMLFLARDSMFTTAVIGFEKAQFLMLGVICLLGVAFLIVNRRNLLQILKDRRMIVAGIAAAVLLLPMLVKRDWQLMYFSVLLCLLTAVFLSYFLTLRDAAKYYVVIMSVLGAYSVLAAYILRIGVDSGAYAVPVFRNSMGFEFHNFFLSIVPDTYVKNRNFGIFREPGVYQFFLITALYLNNYEVEWKKTWQLWLVNGILAATMVSTFATGGVAEMGLLAIVLFLTKMVSGQAGMCRGGRADFVRRRDSGRFHCPEKRPLLGSLRHGHRQICQRAGFLGGADGCHCDRHFHFPAPSHFRCEDSGGAVCHCKQYHVHPHSFLRLRHSGGAVAYRLLGRAGVAEGAEDMGESGAGGHSVHVL